MYSTVSSYLMRKKWINTQKNCYYRNENYVKRHQRVIMDSETAMKHVLSKTCCISMAFRWDKYSKHQFSVSNGHLRNDKSQCQVKIKRRSKRHFSRLNKGFPHAFTCFTGWGVFSPTLRAQITEKNFFENFWTFLSPTTFRPGMLERWNSVFRAKWFCWE